VIVAIGYARRDTSLSARLQSNPVPTRTPIEAWLDAAWLPLGALISVAIAVLNSRAVHNFHTIDKHLVFRERILHGFATTDVMPSYTTPPTFPMWGYGWVLLLTTNTAALIALQMAVALFTVWYFVRVADQIGLLDRWSRRCLQVFILLCTPWYAYHSIDWSQSLATSFLILSLAMLMAVAHGHHAPWRMLALSAVCFGLNLNLASDLYLLPVALVAAWACVARWSRLTIAQALVWLSGVGLTLVPWMIYTWHATGTPLVKSTNQGHVLLMGLAQDPRGRFGITYSDSDPTMYGIIRDQLGDAFARRFYASCSFEADAVLRPAFLRIIRSQPRAYLDLVRIKLARILTGAIGTYGGEFDEGENVGRFGIPQTVRRLVRRYTERIGRELQLGTTLFAPLVIWAAVRRRQPAWALILVPIAYQYVSCSIAVLQPQYVANLIILQLTVCARGLGLVVSRLNAASSR
jgi:hypothetical protein